jgi:hypothetical protein
MTSAALKTAEAYRRTRRPERSRHDRHSITRRSTGKLYIQDVTLRDGMHAIRHQYGLDHVRDDRARALDAPRSMRSRSRMATACRARRSTTASAPAPTGPGSKRGRRGAGAQRLTTLLLPGIGTVHDLKRAYELGVRSVRIATHCTEADVSRQHIEYRARPRHGRVRFPDDEPHEPAAGAGPQAVLMESYGAHCVYVTDSGGAMTMDDVAARLQAYDRVLKPRPARHPRPPQPEPGRRQFRSPPSRTAPSASMRACRHGCGRRQCAAGGLHRRRRRLRLEAWLPTCSR